MKGKLNVINRDNITIFIIDLNKGFNG